MRNEEPDHRSYPRIALGTSGEPPNTTITANGLSDDDFEELKEQIRRLTPYQAAQLHDYLITYYGIGLCD